MFCRLTFHISILDNESDIHHTWNVSAYSHCKTESSSCVFEEFWIILDGQIQYACLRYVHRESFQSYMEGQDTTISSDFAVLIR